MFYVQLLLIMLFITATENQRRSWALETHGLHAEISTDRVSDHQWKEVDRTRAKAECSGGHLRTLI